MNTDPTETIQQILNNYAQQAQSVGVVAGIVSPDLPKKSALLFAGGNGLLNTQHKPLKLDGDTSFEIASITKVFTSAVQYSRHNNYNLTLGDFITAVKFPAALSNLPILDLATYSSGFPQDNHGGWWPRGVAGSLPALLNYLAGSTGLPQEPPGEYYSYSNFGWGLLALAALGVKSESDDVLKEWAEAISALTKNLKMSSSTAPYNPSMDSKLPVGHTKDGALFPIGHSYQPLAPMLFGAGDIVSNGNDMLKWLEFNMGIPDPKSPELKLQQLQTWHRPKFPDKHAEHYPTVATGWFVNTATINGAPVTYLAKDGGARGFTSWMGFQSWIETGAASKFGCFVLANYHSAPKVGRQILNILLGNPSPADVSDETHYVTPPEAEG